MKFGKDLKRLWNLDEDVVFLNHGSFGATPIEVIEKSNEIQYRLEKEPVSFFIDGYFKEIRKSAMRLGEFVRCDSDDLVFVDNASSGVNVVLKSLIGVLKPGDEILITNHSYPAVKNASKYVAEITGAVIKSIDLPFPISNFNEITELYEKAIAEKTKIAVIDHVIYTTGIVAPVKEIAEILKSKGVMVLVDGAHAPGMIDLNIRDLNVDWYTGNCHKWLFTLKGCAFLWTSKEYQSMTKPLTISNFYGQGYNMEFDWAGTKNPAPYLSINPALDFYERMGKSEVISYINKLIIDARNLISSKMNLPLPCPDFMLSSLATLKFPYNGELNEQKAYELRNEFFKLYKCEFPFLCFNDRMWFRVSAQIYNDISDYEYLIEKLITFIKK